MSGSTTTDSDRSTQMSLRIGGEEIRDIRTFSYVQDVMQLANPFSAEIPDPDSKWSRVVTRGAKAEVYLSNPDVNNGRQSLKLTGRVREVEQGTRAGTGRVLRVTGADLGYHLTRDSGPLGFALSRTTYKKLLQALIDGSWEFRGVRFGDANSLNRQIVLGRKQKLLQYTANNEVPLQYIGIEPGEHISAILTDVARFSAKLLTVSADGFLQAWNPDYNRAPAYEFEYHGIDEKNRILNNIEDVSISSSADTLATDITCVGEILLQLDQVHPDDPHPGRKIGSSRNPVLLPYVCRETYTDTEQFSAKYCQANAEWKMKMNIFNSWAYKCSSPYHHQRGTWFAADMMVSLLDTVNHDDSSGIARGISGNYWIPRVELHWDKDKGGGTSFVIRHKDLLTAPIVGKGGIDIKKASTLVHSEKAPQP
jgi:hypothetical protein